MAVRLSEVERAYYVRKAGGAEPTKPLNQIKREYWASVIGAGSANSPFSELENQWKMKVLATAGITPSNPNSEADLWRQLVVSIGQTPTLRINENKMIFYLNAA